MDYFKRHWFAGSGDLFAFYSRMVVLRHSYFVVGSLVARSTAVPSHLVARHFAIQDILRYHGSGSRRHLRHVVWWRLDDQNGEGVGFRRRHCFCDFTLR